PDAVLHRGLVDSNELEFLTVRSDDDDEELGLPPLLAAAIPPVVLTSLLSCVLGVVWILDDRRGVFRSLSVFREVEPPFPRRAHFRASMRSRTATATTQAEQKPARPTMSQRYKAGRLSDAPVAASAG